VAASLSAIVAILGVIGVVDPAGPGQVQVNPTTSSSSIGATMSFEIVVWKLADDP
jgi:hypothetical protein